MQIARVLRLCIIGLLIALEFPLVYGKSSHESTPEQYYLFEENKGQFHPNVLFRCRLPNGFLFLESDGLTYLLENQDDKALIMERLHQHSFIGPQPIITQRSHSIKVKFIGGNPSATAIGIDTVSYYNNYFIGSNRDKWQSKVRLYKSVLYTDVYDQAFLRFYTSYDGHLKYDWELFADAHPEDIKLQFEGADDLSLRNDSFFVNTSCGIILETPPIIGSRHTPPDNSVEAAADQTHEIDCRFELNGNILSYRVENSPYDHSGGFTIDPALIFSTYSGSRGDNFGFTATYDSKSSLYAGGITNGNQGEYPVTSGAIQEEYGGGGAGLPETGLACDITISKYDSAGSQLLWATYLGGQNNEYPHSLVVNQDDDLYVFGTSYSGDFPTSKTGYDTSFNGVVDIIVAKISEDGSQLLGSTFIGGSDVDGLNSNPTLRYNYADDFRGDIIPDENKDIFIASCTKSADFPRVNSIDTTLKFQEGCLLQLNSDLSELKWATFLGGGAQDALYSVKVDVDSMVYVGGGTSSSDLKTSDNAINKSYLGKIDGYVAALDRKNHKLKELTYWGTKEYDQVYFIDLNEDGALFVAGQTTGNIKPSSATLYGEANRGQFIAKLDTGLRNIEWQTSFGARTNQIDISPSAFLVDNCEHIYVSGWGSEVRPDLNPGSTLNLETSANAVQKETDGNDFYIIVLDKDAQGLLYATYFGGDTSGDHVDGGTSRFDKKGVVYQSVCSSCPDGFEPGHQDFPVTSNAAFTTNFSPRCSNASFKIDLQIKTDVDAYFVPNPTIGCQPVVVDFDNRSDVAEKFIWDFGDGVLDSTTLNPNHTYSEPGVYEVTLTVIDSNTCNISDVFRRTIQVVGKSDAQFEYTLDPCSYESEFKATGPAFNYFWDLGEGTTSTDKKFKHTFEPNTKTTVTLYVDRGTLCADSTSKEVSTDVAERDIFIPNVFTPNSDNLNDEYCISGYLDGCDEFELSIYNRWGELVFKTKDMNECWDGSVMNSDRQHPEGTYFYILEVTEGKYSLEEQLTPPGSYKTNGIVSLIR